MLPSPTGVTEINGIDGNGVVKVIIVSLLTPSDVPYSTCLLALTTGVLGLRPLAVYTGVTVTPPSVDTHFNGEPKATSLLPKYWVVVVPSSTIVGAVPTVGVGITGAGTYTPALDTVAILTAAGSTNESHLIK